MRKPTARFQKRISPYLRFLVSKMVKLNSKRIVLITRNCYLRNLRAYKLMACAILPAARARAGSYCLLLRPTVLKVELPEFRKKISPFPCRALPRSCTGRPSLLSEAHFATKLDDFRQHNQKLWHFEVRSLIDSCTITAVVAYMLLQEAYADEGSYCAKLTASL